MLEFAPMALVDDFLIQYNIGQAVLFLFILSIPATLIQSQKIFSLNAIAFGLLFVIIPSIGGGPVHFAFLGIALLVIGPLLYTTAAR